MEWAFQDPRRFLSEREALQKLFESQEWLTAIKWRIENSVIEVDIDLSVSGKTFEGTLFFPDLFPQTPPYIRPRNSSESWSLHQYGPGGSLCLQWRDDNWLPSVTGADLVSSAYTLLSAENHPEHPIEVPSAHRLTRGQETRSSRHRLIVTREFHSAITSLAPGETRRILTKSLFHRSSTHITTVSFVAKVETGGSDLEIHDIPSGLNVPFPLFPIESKGHVLKSALFDGLPKITSVAHLSEIIELAGYAREVILPRESTTGEIQDQLVVAAGMEPTSLHAFGIEGGMLHQFELILPDPGTRRLPTGYEALSGVKVCIVGLGSIGSKVAVSLARSGLRKFMLVDDDILLPENLCRHELNWSSVGVHKADAVRQSLLFVAPEIDVTGRLHRFAGQESAMMAATVLKEIGACDLIIDATATHKVFLRLAALAHSRRRALCWCEVFTGGIGGLVARARPDLDPNPLAVRTAINQFLSKLPPAPFQAAAGYDVESDEPLLADDGDVTHLASCLTRIALDAALRRVPSLFPYAAYLVGLRKEWIFSQPFDTQPIETKGEGWERPEEWEGIREERVKVLGELLSFTTEAENDQTESSGRDSRDN